MGLASVFLPVLVVAMMDAASAVAGEEAGSPSWPTPAADTEGAEQAGPTLPDSSQLARLAAENIEAARPLLRRAARSGTTTDARADALLLLGRFDASVATLRICARALRLDEEPLVRRAGAECLGRLGPAVASPATPSLVAALKDHAIDVVTMAGWALAAVGDSASVGPVAALATHEDPRVAQLFTGYAQRMLTRLGLVRRAPAGAPRDAEGRELVPPAAQLATQFEGLEAAASIAWLGSYGLMLGWLHGGAVPSAHGGFDATSSAGVSALLGATLGVTVSGTYAYLRARNLRAAHTVVQLGTLGMLAGLGAGQLSGFPPSSAVAAADLALVGTLAGTAAGVALVETGPPTIDALGVGLVSGLSAGVAIGSVWSGYGLAERAGRGAALLGGSSVGLIATLAGASSEVGLFPIAGGFVGTLLGAGAGALLVAGPGAGLDGEAAGWTVAAATIAGTALGSISGLALPSARDPLGSVAPRIAPPTLGAVAGPRGSTTSILAATGSF